MLRPRTYAIVIALLVVLNVAWWIFSGWGLITIHAKKQPLAAVIRQIEKQGHVTMRTDLPAETEVTMKVDKVPLTEALETLSAVTESGWRLTYLSAPSKAVIEVALGKWAAGQRPEDWKPIFSFGQQSPPDPDAYPPDPRLALWDGKPADAAGTPATGPDSAGGPGGPWSGGGRRPRPDPGTLQAYLFDVSRETGAGFSLPNDWNPPVSAAPAAGEVRKVVPKLLASAGGVCQEVFLLTQGRRGRRSDAAGGAAPEGGSMSDGGGFRMPPEMRPDPAIWQEIRSLPEDQRQARMAQIRQQIFSDPAVQGKIDDRMAARESRQTPEQRLKRYRAYVARRAAAQGAH